MQPERIHTQSRPRPSVEKDAGVKAAYASYTRRKLLIIAAFVIILVALSLFALSVGSKNLSASEVVGALFGQGEAQARQIIWNLRMPHILTALLGGIALALAGCALQSVLGNPLASPSTLGISQGAAFGASLAIIVFGAGTAGAQEGVMFTNATLTAVLAFFGALISTLIVLGISKLRNLSPESIVLAGVALSALFAGATAMIQYFATDTQVAAVVFWTFGSLRRTGATEISIIAIVTAASAVFFWFNRWNFNAMESGEYSAHSLGVNVTNTRAVSMIVATVAASTVIAFCGTINFVGLVAPHVMRRFIGSDYRFLLPASALAGAILLLASDLIASSVVPGAILPISSITAFVGAPLFIYLLLKGLHR